MMWEVTLLDSRDGERDAGPSAERAELHGYATAQVVTASTSG